MKNERCKEKPPNDLDECAKLRWQLEQAKDCRRLQQAWDDKWQPGRHQQAIKEWGNRIKKLENKIKSKKCGCS